MIFYAGDDCELDYDACSVSPCSAGTNCTDRPAAEQEANQSLTAYTCSPCPTGYQENGTKCEGNEMFHLISLLEEVPCFKSIFKQHSSLLI